MITDPETNVVFISALLKDRHPEFHASLASILKDENIDLMELEHTKDIWCADYMPVQISLDRFAQFKYDPDYLKDEDYSHLRSDQAKVLAPLSVDVTNSDLVIDGGNIVRHRRKAIITDKIFEENELRSKPDILQEILTILDVEEIIIVPRVPYDYTGHADGMVRFVNHNTVLLNDFSSFHFSYYEKLKKSLTWQGLNIIHLPWNGAKQTVEGDDLGDYINFLHVGNLIIVPEFMMETDEAAKATISHCYPEAKVTGIDCRQIGLEGGLLHCCTWNIKAKLN